MTQCADVGGSGSFAKHGLNGIAGNQMNEHKNQRDHQPDDREGENQAGENLLHGSLLTINQDAGLESAG